MLATLYNRILIMLAFAGIFVAGVLSAGAYYEKDIPCGASHGCAVVAAHPTSHLLGGVPNAYLGLLLYFALAAVAVARELMGVRKAPELVIVGLIFSGIGSLFSIYLTYIAIHDIHATCLWCLSSLGIILVTTILHGLMSASLGNSESAPTAKGPGIAVIALSALLSFGALTWQIVGLANEVSGMSTPTGYTDNQEKSLYGPTAHIRNPNGEITLVEFGDLVCPTCRKLYPQIDGLVEKSHGKIRYIFHHYPIYQLAEHKDALPGAAIAELCAEKGKFYDFIKACYSGDEKAPEPTLEDMLTFAQALGVDPDAARKRIVDTDDSSFKKVNDDINLANAFGIHATPTFLLIVPGKKLAAVVGSKIIDVLGQDEYKQYFK